MLMGITLNFVVFFKNRLQKHAHSIRDSKLRGRFRDNFQIPFSAIVKSNQLLMKYLTGHNK